MHTTQIVGDRGAVCMHAQGRRRRRHEPTAWPAARHPLPDRSTDDGHTIVVRQQTSSRSAVSNCGPSYRAEVGSHVAPVPQQALRQLAPAHRASGPEQRQRPGYVLEKQP
jgi:hypothetical protein